MNQTVPVAEAGQGEKAGNSGWPAAVFTGMVLGAALFAFSPRPAPVFTPTQVFPDRVLINGLAQNGKRILAAGEQGHILVADDPHGPWRDATVEPQRGSSFTQVHYIGDGVALAVGHDDWIVRSEDNGQTWKEVSFNKDPDQAGERGHERRRAKPSSTEEEQVRSTLRRRARAGVGAKRGGGIGRVAASVLAAAGLASLGLTAAPAPADAGSYVPVSGSGSSWAAIAIDQWSQAVRPSGIVVNYNPDGSASGRGDYMANQDDFAGSDPPFRNGHDYLGGTGAETPGQGYSYIPDTAGGTALIYHIDVNGQLVTNLRLDPTTLFDIFTGAITNWDDKRITHIYGQQLPNLPITPVIRSDGSGATYFFTLWMASVFPSQWNKFCSRVHPGVHIPCGQTEFYPQFGNAKAENGSNNVMAYITSTYGNGSIGYDEYAYAINAHYPVVQLLNPAHYFVGPTASNVAVSLHHAVINEQPSSPNFLQQDLHALYTLKDPRDYPLSSYSYLIVPRSGTQPPTNFTTSKGRTLSTWINYLLCGGQSHLAGLGYSPLPANLVSGGLLQNAKIPGNVSIRFNQLRGCNNPTMNHGVDTLLAKAKYPGPCQKLGAPLNCVVKNGRAVAAGGSTSTGPTSAASAGATIGATGPAAVTGPSAGATGPGTGVVVNLAADPSNETKLGVLTALGILLAVAVPPGMAAWLRRRRGQARG